MGAGLLAKTAAQSTLMSPDIPLSRASPLPQVKQRSPKLAHSNSRLSFQQLIAHDARVCRFGFFLESVCNSYFRQVQIIHAGLTR
ncbi:hypothetical protein C5612_19520 [Pseudomonas frederiksbergensis]|uniref:Uncharacterized protein n=1 Tax=Pseudomonas frederiksbergensis TaxID=104087 RepID=A0A2S8HGB4_9PSED|nr:hypothetical protein C5612_19520 [Pseudomonas frederiksbergensis]